MALAHDWFYWALLSAVFAALTAAAGMGGYPPGGHWRPHPWVQAMSVRVFREERSWTSSTDAAIQSQWRFCMPRLIIGVMVTLTLSFLWVPTLAATESPGRIPRIGLLIPTSTVVAAPMLEAFRQALQAFGYQEGKTLILEIRFEEMIPGLARVAVLWDAHSGAFGQWGMMLGARVAGIRLQVLEVRGSQEFEQAFAAATREHAEVLIIPGSGLFAMHQSRLAALALQNRLPTLAPFREFAQAGGLLAYGPNAADLFRRAAAFVDQLLRGAKPADLPIERPRKFDFVINLKTAQALGLTLPSSLLSQADEIIR